MSQNWLSVGYALFCLFCLLCHSLAHIQMAQPIPFRSPLNKALASSQIDYDNTAPLNSDGSNFPCKGYHERTPWDPVATYLAGEEYELSLAGGANHGGGSCQISLSSDGGLSFKVIKSIIGGCTLDSATYKFRIPVAIPSSTLLFAWTWLNHEGNREFYMNCAPISVVGTGSDDVTAEEALSSYPNIFVANLVGINACTTKEGTDPVFCNPGEDVEYGGSYSAASPPTPDCRGCDVIEGNVLANGNSDNGLLQSVGHIMAEISVPQLLVTHATISTIDSALAARAGETTTVYALEPCDDLPVVTITVVPPRSWLSMHGEWSTTLTTSTRRQSPSMTSFRIEPTLPSPSPSPSRRPPPSPPPPLPNPEPQATIPPYATDPARYPPCQHGAFLCTSETTWLTCTQLADLSWSWTSPRVVANGMMCLPYLNPAGYREDKYTAARPYGACLNDGAIKCNGPQGFMM